MKVFIQSFLVGWLFRIKKGYTFALPFWQEIIEGLCKGKTGGKEYEVH
jgi:hypothetical protein